MFDYITSAMMFDYDDVQAELGRLVGERDVDYPQHPPRADCILPSIVTSATLATCCCFVNDREPLWFPHWANWNNKAPPRLQLHKQEHLIKQEQRKQRLSPRITIVYFCCLQQI
jgi:hypothetical protein